MIALERKLDIDMISTLKHCAGEVVEATEAFTRLRSCTSQASAEKLIEETGLEIADIIICALTASVALGVDIEDCLNKAMQKNARRAYAEGN
jgi:NTP pyrophosphatase (non-canonical NTP hydrolase)